MGVNCLTGTNPFQRLKGFIMKAATPDFKRKVYKGLRLATCFPVLLLGISGAFFRDLPPNVYHDHFSKTEAGEKAQKQEFAELEKRIAGIPPLRRYVDGLREQSEVVMKLPADALPAGTDPQKMRAQSEKLAAAVEAEVRATAAATVLSPNLTLGDARELQRSLLAAAGKGLEQAATVDTKSAGPLHIHYEACRAEITAAPGYKPDAEAVKKVFDCTAARGKPYQEASSTLASALYLSFLAAGLVRWRLGKRIRKEDQDAYEAARNAEEGAEAMRIAAKMMPPKPAPQAAPVIDTATGQDITVKPIKITAKSHAAP
jgi:hypothetical protein